MTEVLRASRRGDMAVAVRDEMDVDDFERARGEEPSPRTTRPLSPYAESSSGVHASHSSYEVDAGGDGQERMRMTTAAIMEYPAGYRDMICMCIQTPRIPRPRNAFILYRQYHQSRVMSENPSLSNPEISRIIGERWKNEEPDVKEDWKGLAEKEKQRHASRYPNYRYQPRRNVKPQGWTASPMDEERGRCPKCRGRLTSLTPRTAVDPYTSPGASRMGSSAQHQPGQEGPRPSLSRMDAEGSGAISSGSVSPLTVVNRLPLPSPFANSMTADGDASSPDLKRRRMSSIGDYHLVGRQQDVSLAAHSIMEPRRVAQEDGGWRHETNGYGPVGFSLPELGSLPGLDRLPMPPPPRPSDFWRFHGSEATSSRGSVLFDESLRLPPLRTSISPGSRGMNDGRFDSSIWDPANPAATHGDCGGRPSEGSHPKAISRRQKLNIMARVCRPAPVPQEGTTPAARGPFIAIEGPDENALREVGIAVEQALTCCEDVCLRVWTCSDATPDGRAPRDGQPMPAHVLRCFLETLERGQDVSQEITRYITRELEETKGEQPAALPVALVKDGFSLTHTDMFARTPTGVDEHSPLDHWRWTASLWRDTIRPDLVIYVESSDPGDAEDGGGGASGEDGGCPLEAVETENTPCGLLVVRMAKDGRLDEGAEKRLMVELTRWIREGAYREAVRED